MKIKVVSDLHICFMNQTKKISTMIIPKQEDDSETVLVIAGDFGKFSQETMYVQTLNHLANRFRDIIIVAGNHEFYGYNDFPNIPTTLLKKLASNVHFLDKTVKVIDDVAFLGCSLFTDMNNSNPIDIQSVRFGMNDFNYIKKVNLDINPYGNSMNKVIEPEDYITEFNKCKEFIFTECKFYTNPVVVTHFIPTYETISFMYRTSRTNAGYCSSLENEILDSNIKYWCCGHQHQRLDTMVGNTTIIQNAFGYWTHEVNCGFNSNLTIEL